jgi:hypothetical protein
MGIQIEGAEESFPAEPAEEPAPVGPPVAEEGPSLMVAPSTPEGAGEPKLEV